MSRHTQRTEAYNTAYLNADRSHLVDAFDLDPAGAGGRIDAAFEELVPPTDHERRRRAVLEFYGHRCGRCARPVAATDADEDEFLGYAFSVGRVRGAEEPWALDELVALCEPCFDLVDAAGADALGRVATRFREAPQFPSWHCDPRVAVERAPLSGRELFRRELVARQVEPRFDFRVNDAVAEHAALALPTPATRAVAFGEAVLERSAAPPSDGPCPEWAWESLPPEARVDYERRTLTPREIAEGDRWARPSSEDHVADVLDDPTAAAADRARLPPSD